MKKSNATTGTHVVVGIGEVGAALQEVLSSDGHDPYKNIFAHGHYDVMHVAFPYTGSKESYKQTIDEYRKIFTPELVIIHSSVPLGTSRYVDAVHSPIRGVHPHIAQGIRTFVKFFGGSRAQEAAAIFTARGIETYTTSQSEETEAGKLWDTTQYGVFILLNKEIHEFCEKNNLNFDVVYTMFNKTYNDGYRNLGREEVVRPYLRFTSGPIGGHCVVENAHLLESPSAERIKRENTLLKSLSVTEHQQSSGVIKQHS